MGEKIRRSKYSRPRDHLRAAENCAVRIRKLLIRCQQRPGIEGIWESTDDAVRLTELIERLARFGQTRPADEAVNVVAQIEVLISLLQAETDSLHPDGSA